MASVPKECKKTVDYKTGSRIAPCPFLGYVSSSRPAQSQYCDQCKVVRDRERRDENRDLYRAKYDATRAAHRRAHWAETHDGQTWAEYVAERRSRNRDKVRDSNRRAAAKYRAKRKQERLNLAKRSRDELAVLLAPCLSLFISKPAQLLSEQNDFFNQIHAGPIIDSVDV